MTATMQANGIDFSPTGQNISGFTVLIVDDSPLNLDVAFACLESKGYKVISAGNGIEALKIAEQVKPSLILLDIMMPEMDGFETCRRLKNLEGLKDIPVIFITAMTDIKSKREGFAAGAVDYVTKPFQPEELAARVQTHISLQLAYQHLKDSELRYRRLVETTPDAILVQNDRGIVYLNSSAMRLFGVDTPEELLGASLLEYAAKDDRELAEKQIALMCETEPGDSSPLILHLLHADGSVVDVETSCSGITYQSIDSQMFVLRNVTERLRQEAVIEFQATHDPLTGLPNRSLYFGRVTQAIYHALRSGERLAVMFIDLDKFKLINDTLGHNAGDELLRVMANRLKGCTRDCDTLARISGDKFAIILTSETGPDRIADFADTVLQSAKIPISYADDEITLSLSLGLASWVDENQSAEMLISDAELALYRAKREGGDRVEPFRPAFRSSNAEAAQFEADLRRAIDRRELSLVYQPIVRLSDNSIAGLEALMRWEHPKRGEVPPSEFIAVAESIGLINRLGLFAMDRAATDLAKWREQNGELPIFMSVNLSSAQLLNKTLLEDFQAVLAKTECKAGDFRLELTETMMMENPEQSNQLLRRLREVGFSIALDDFGTGYSALSYLTSFPFSTVKIDRSLVVRDDEQGRKLLSAIVGMIRDQGMEIVAEGISTTQEAEMLAEIGCDYGQSYLFGPPLGAQNVGRLLKDSFPLTA